MDLSETILAASIGAAATVSTALFQLFGAIRANKSSATPKRGNTVRSIIAVLALMIASGVGGFMFSELRQERAATNIQSLRDELSAKLQVLEVNTARLAERAAAQPVMSVPQPEPQPTALAATDQAQEHEVIIYAPACGQQACTEAQAQTMALCESVPVAMRVTRVDLFVRGANAQLDWELSRVAFDQDAGGAKFLAPMQETASDDSKRVCVNFMHWSAEPHVARMVLRVSTTPEMSAPTGHVVDGELNAASEPAAASLLAGSAQ